MMMSLPYTDAELVNQFMWISYCVKHIYQYIDNYDNKHFMTR